MRFGGYPRWADSLSINIRALCAGLSQGGKEMEALIQWLDVIFWCMFVVSTVFFLRGLVAFSAAKTKLAMERAYSVTLNSLVLIFTPAVLACPPDSPFRYPAATWAWILLASFAGSIIWLIIHWKVNGERVALKYRFLDSLRAVLMWFEKEPPP